MSHTKSEKIEMVEMGSEATCSKENSVNNPELNTNFWLSTRSVVAWMGLTGAFILFSMRIGMNIAIVSMTQSNVSDASNASKYNLSGTSGSTNESGFHWTQHQIGLVLAVYFIGGSLSKIPCAFLLTKFAPKNLILLLFISSSICSFLVPFAARLSIYCLIVLRIISGLIEGSFAVSFSELSVRWVHPSEKSTFRSFQVSGRNTARTFSPMISGYLCSRHFLGGWPLIFYTFGTLAGIWAIICYFFIYSSPEDHPSLSSAELNYITSTRLRSGKSLSTPWKQISTSVPFWAYLAGVCSMMWGGIGVTTCLPLYFRNVLKFDIASNGVLSGLPFFADIIVTILAALLSDYLISKGIFSTTIVRKVNQFVGVFFSAVCLIGVGFIGDNKLFAVVLITLGMAFLGFTNTAAAVNHIDLSFQYSTRILAVALTLVPVCGIIAPNVVSFIINDEPNSPDSWRVVFLVFAMITFLLGMVFVIFSSGNNQQWGVEQKVNETVQQRDEKSTSQETPCSATSNRL